MKETQAGTDRWLRRLAAGWNSNAALYLGLLFLVWGLTVPMRGMWQDDTLLLRLARNYQGQGFLAAFVPVGAPLRRLYGIPYRIALETAQPIWTMHLLFGAIWLGQALAAGWITRLLLPGKRLTQFVAVCLTLTATSDYLTDNLTVLGYNAGALLLLVAFGCSLQYGTAGKARWVVLACATAAASIWTIDVGIPALPFLPLLLVWIGGIGRWRRSVVLLGALGVTLAPAAWIEWRFLHDPYSYAAVAMKPLPFAERMARTEALWRENFTPWRWVFDRPVWYPRPPAAIPFWAMALASGLAAAWFLFCARRLENPGRPERSTGTLLMAAMLAVMALASNAAYAAIQMSDIHYRTHILSRVWASLAIAVLAGWTTQRWPRFRSIFLIVPLVFVGFGVWGGLERQDLWVSTWRLHQKELLSIVTTAPALAPDTGIILRSQPTPNLYLATEADYLSESWLLLLYDRTSMHDLRLASDRGTGCRATPDGLDCWHEGQAECVAKGTCAGDRFPYEKLVILDFDDRTGTYSLLADPRGDALLGDSPVALALYRPAGLIRHRPLTQRQRALLLQ